MVKLDWQHVESVPAGCVRCSPSRVSGGLGQDASSMSTQLTTLHPRYIPCALRDIVKDCLVAEGTLEPVEIEWAAPIMPVVKQSVRICGDFRTTINPISKLDNYPIPKVNTSL